MNQSTENISHLEEYEGEEHVPHYICVKKEEESEIESTISECSEAKTSSGNILKRIIKDPDNHRPPCLGKWPEYPQYSESDLEENPHQHRAAQQPTPLSQMCSLRITSEPNPCRQPAIIGTIGPSSIDVPSIVELLDAGMNIARINMAHANQCNIKEPFRNVIEASHQFRSMKDYEIPVGIMMDLKGPEMRTGKINPESIKLNEGFSFIPLGKVSKEKYMGKNNVGGIYIKQGNFVRLTSDKIFEDRCSDKIIYLDYADLSSEILQDMVIYLSDGQIKLKVNSIESINIVCYVEVGGILKNNQKVHIPMLPLAIPAISDYDIQCLELAAELDVDMVVVPSTRNAEMIQNVRKILGPIQKGNMLVLAKISNFEGLENIECILTMADGIVIHKSDLSLEISPEKMFIAQKEIIGKCNRAGKPALCTGQISSLKTSNHVSSRIEMSDIGGAIVDGADGIILIAETATGDQGIQAVNQLSNIIREAEAATMQKPFYFDLVDEQRPSIEPSKAIALAAVQIANKIQASAILTVTTSGKTAQLLSWFRPRQPVIAITRLGQTARQIHLWRAVIPLHYSAEVLPSWFDDVNSRFEYGLSYGRDNGIIQSGDLLVLVSGYRKKAGFTNCIRVVVASQERNKFVDSLSDYYSNPKLTITEYKF